jgi:membrane protein DedA with SNARE-associated domain
MLLAAILTFLAQTAPEAGTSDRTFIIRIAAGVLALACVVIIVLRRKKKAAKEEW